MTNNNEHWNTVDWSQIPEDVQAVVTFECMTPNYYKTINGVLVVKDAKETKFIASVCNSILEAQEAFGNRFHLRPTPSTQPTPEPPESTQVESSQVEATTTPEFDWSTVDDDDVEAVILSPVGKCRAMLKEAGDKLWIKGKPLPNWFITREATTIENYPVKQFQDGDGKIVRRPPATSPLDKMEEPVLHQIGVDTYESHMKRYEEVYREAYTKLLTDTLHVTNKLDDQPISCKVEFYEGTVPEGMIDFDPAKIIAGDKDLQQICSGYKFKVHGGKPIKYEVSKVDKATEHSVPSIQSILSDAQELIKKHHSITGEVKFTIKCR